MDLDDGFDYHGLLLGADVGADVCDTFAVVSDTDAPSGCVDAPDPTASSGRRSRHWSPSCVDHN